MKMIDILIRIFPSLKHEWNVLNISLEVKEREVARLSHEVIKLEMQISKDKMKELQRKQNEITLAQTPQVPSIVTKEIVKYETKYVPTCDSGWYFIKSSGLPACSISEIIVTDGEIVSTVQYDNHTKRFLKSFGSQCMHVPNPIAWRMMPFPPDHNDKEKVNMRSKMHQHAHTYIR